MKPSDVTSPEYYHKVVDCQYACPAHTPVPEYIRLIADGRYSDAYIVNRESNVFPGILGRVCDRPCEPACRRGRLGEPAVAICRLKRVAADYKGADIEARLPPIPQQKNGKRVALVGAGPASLTVANDLLPLGYDCVLYEKEAKPGGAMLTQVPSFRLPQAVLDEEIGYITERGGLDCRFGQEVKSLKGLLGEGYDAVFIGTGAPLGRDLPLPGRQEAQQSIHIGLEFLANTHFKHLSAIKKNVLIIGGGNTAMDCCRTALRLGAGQVTVVAPEAYDEMLASPWEKDDAVSEGVGMRNNLLPQEFVHHNGHLTGVRFQVLRQCYDAAGKWQPVPSGEPDVVLPCDEVVLAIGQGLTFPFIEDELGLRRQTDAQGRFTAQYAVDPVTLQSSLPQVFFGGDAALGPRNIITAVAQAHEAAISIHAFCQGADVAKRLPRGMNLVSQKMAMNQWSYHNAFSDQNRQAVPHASLQARLQSLDLEVEKGFDLQLAAAEAGRCLNCDVQTVFHEELCIECDACVDICPVGCLTMTPNAEEDELRLNLTRPALNREQALFVAPLPQTKRVMVKDENVCLHCGLCAERCPTAAWDMQAFTLFLPHAKDLQR